MTTQTENEHDASVAHLATGIVDDARQLLVEQLTLFQVEIKHHVSQTIRALIPLGVGIVISFIALFLLGTGAAYFLNWQWPELPLWGAFLITGGAILAVAIALILWAVSILERISFTPDVALKGLKENLQWKTKN